MRHILKYPRRIVRPAHIVVLSIIVGTLCFANFVSATTKTAGPLEVTYDGDTIFAEANLAPGSVTEKPITIKNNGTVNHSFAIATTGLSGDLSNQITLSPVVDGSIVWTKTIDELSKLPEQSLTIISNINPGQTIPVALRAELPKDAKDDNQSKNLSFDIIFGTQESEPIVGGGGVAIASLGRGALTQTATTSVASVTSEQSTSSEEAVKGGGKAGSDNFAKLPIGKNKRLLLIVPIVSILALAAFTSSWRRNILLPLMAGSAAFLLSNYFHGDMGARIFWLILGAETIGAVALKMIIKDYHRHHIKRLHQKYFARKMG